MNPDDKNDEFIPDNNLLEQLLAMGVAYDAAIEGLFCTGNKSLDEAVDYVFSSGSNNSPALSKLAANISNRGSELESSKSDAEEYEQQDYKMTFVVNTSLKMGVGKIAAQVGHACVGLYRDMQREKLQELLDKWEEVGEKKIVLKGVDHQHLQELYEKGQQLNIPTYLVRDAGHTQIAPGSVTVVSLFGLEDDVDKITGKLGLL